MAMHVFECVQCACIWCRVYMWCRTSMWSKRWRWGSCADRRTPPKTKTRERQKHQIEEEDTKSPKKLCTPDFSSSSMVTGQVAWWYVGRKRRWKRRIFLEWKFLIRWAAGEVERRWKSISFLHFWVRFFSGGTHLASIIIIKCLHFIASFSSFLLLIITKLWHFVYDGIFYTLVYAGLRWWRPRFMKTDLACPLPWPPSLLMRHLHREAIMLPRVLFICVMNHCRNFASWCRMWEGLY